MSGGSLNYFFRRLDEIIPEIQKYYDEKYCPIHGSMPCRETYELTRKFKMHLVKVSKALREIEWVMSGDNGDEQEMKSIINCIE